MATATQSLLALLHQQEYVKMSLSTYYQELAEQLGNSIEDLHALRTRPMHTIKKELK
jgi:hypothetical protein